MSSCTMADVREYLATHTSIDPSSIVDGIRRLVKEEPKLEAAEAPKEEKKKIFTRKKVTKDE